LNNFLKIEINRNRIYGLDILRALAILFVVFGHGNYLVETEIYKYLNYFLFDGVSIFFVLSGFLIGGILIKLLNDNTLSFKLVYSFWKRRWLRTIPNYFLILTILITLNLIFKENFKIIDILHYYVFSQNLFYKHPDFFPEAWSLSVEEWFYFLIPIIIFGLISLFKTTIKKSVFFTSISLIVISILIRYFFFQSMGDIKLDEAYWGWKFRGSVVTRLDSLMFGVVGAYWSYYFNDSWIKYKYHFFIIGILIFITMKFNLFNFLSFNFFDSVFSFTFTSLGTLFLLPYLSNFKNGKGIIYISITIISLISYSMYLVNLSIVQYWLLDCINWKVISDFNSYFAIVFKYFLYWLLTIIISILIYKYFELPIMKLRDKKYFSNN
jgi:peptidoglycan/LPS O-acetylase OafA/YrhL